MRKIKFRAWDIKSGACDCEICIGKANGADSYITYLGLGETEIIDDTIIVEQYTGLKDKNGVEIYEGDIMSLGDNENRYVVKYKLNGFILESDHVDFDESAYFIERKVIGNIHENKELLNES